MRHFSRAHRCVTYSQRGYPPSDVPRDRAKYGQDIARDDVIAVMDALKIDKAHVVGHSMGALTALHVGINIPTRCISVTAAGCGYGSSPDAEKSSKRSRAPRRRDRQDVHARKAWRRRPRNMPTAPMRQTHKHKDPRGYAEFARMLERAFRRSATR